MSKGKKTTRKKYQLLLDVPDQRHLSYLSDAHAIHSARLVASGKPVKNFENFLLDCVFQTANGEIQAYSAAIKKQQEAAKAAQAETETEVKEEEAESVSTEERQEG